MTTTTLMFDVDLALEQHRVALKGYCSRMLGSAIEAEDAVQETLVRGWRHIDRFEGRSSLRSWLYSIATNVCFDMLRGRRRIPQPMEVSDGEVVAQNQDPADVAVERDGIRRAFVAALRQLPSRQRAVVILRDVLRWEATEVAELLGTTAAAVNSMHQRARPTLAAGTSTRSTRRSPGEIDDALVACYVDAFERYDVTRLVSLLRDAA